MAHLRVAVLHWNIGAESEEAQGVARQVREELIPLLQSMPGFISYQTFGASEQAHTSVSVTSWASAAQADAGNQKIGAWTDELLSRYLVGRDVYTGEVTLAS